jgi:DNA-binding NarL/FixJ family response regulator
MTERIRVLIADDHLFYREGLKAMLEARPEIEVVGGAADGAAALALAEACEPDVILMDVRMPGLNGIDATRRICSRHPRVAVLVLTMFDDETVFGALRAGARGYLLKDASLDDLLRAITAAQRGEAIFSPSIARRLSRYFSQQTPSRDPDLFPELTDRERDVLALLAEAKDNAEIAQALHLTPKTVRNYVSSVIDKLHVNDRGEAILRARQAGFGSQTADR